MKDSVVCWRWMLAMSSFLLVASMHLPEDSQGSTGKIQTKTAVPSSAGHVQDSTVRSFVDGGVIMTFPSAMADQLRQDIQYTVLLAQRAADNKKTDGYQFSRNTQLEQWVDFFNNVLANVDWTIQTKNTKPTDLQVTERKFTLSDLILKVMSKSSMASDVDTFKKVLSTFNGLPNTDDAVKIFTNRTYDPKTRDTTVIVISVHQTSPSSDALMSLLLLNLGGVKDSTTRPLAHTYTTKDVKTKKVLLTQQVFDQELYSQIRQQIADKLKPFIKTDIKEITLKQ